MSTLLRLNPLMLMLGWIGALATAGAVVTCGAAAGAAVAPTPPRLMDDFRAVVAGEATAGAAGVQVSYVLRAT